MRKLIKTTIDNISHEGRGVSRINGKTTFIHNALSNETVEFYYTRKHRSLNEGQAENILAASNQRSSPPCPHYHFCGGCSLQHWQHDYQIIHKQQQLAEQLQHFANAEPQQWLPPIIGPLWQYRHKARLGVRHVPGKVDVLVGFRERNGRYLTDMRSCHILHPSVGDNIDSLRQLISQLSIYQYIAQIEVAVGDSRTALIFRHLQNFSDQDLDRLMAYGDDKQFDIYLQPGKADSIHKIYPRDTEQRLTMSLGHHQLKLRFHPTDFTQINPTINQKMIAQALALLNISHNDHVLDLFCGIGNFSLPLAKYAKQVTAIEGSEEMVKRGQENAQYNQINNIDFYHADLSQPLDHHAWAKQQYDSILVDPPRSGASAIVNNINHLAGKRIVYISCHPASLARDSALLIRQGYQLKKAGIMDMFPQTSHVESIALFEK